MYIPPGFTVLTCEGVNETAFQSWAVLNSGAWQAAQEGLSGGCREAHAKWEFMEAKIGMLSQEDKSEWTPLMHKPPLGIIDVELSRKLDEGNAQCVLVIQSMFARWDSYAHDLGIYDWVSTLLHEVLPPERIIRFEPPLPGPPPAWIWVKGIYKKNEDAR